MRVQQMQRSFSSRRKLAALLALIAPGLAIADETQNVLRHGDKANASQSWLQSDSKNEVRAVDHIDLLPLPDELRAPAIASIRAKRDETSSRRQGESVVVADGWTPRTPRSTAVSPLVIDPLAVPLLPGPSNQQIVAGRRVGDGLVASGEVSGQIKPGIKIGESASSTLKIVPNALEPVPKSVDLQPEMPAESSVGGATSEPVERIALADKANPADVNNPEQNEPAGELTADEIAAADSAPSGESDGVIPEPSAAVGVMNGEDNPPEPFANDAPGADAEGDSGKRPDAAAAPLAIRKLRLNADSQSISGSGDPVSLKPLDPSIAKMRVGDVEPESLSEYDSNSSGGDLVQPPPRPTNSASNNPIQGDTITDSGELILATGGHSSNIAVKPNTLRLKPMIERTLKYYWDRPEDAAERTHWGMMHSIMVFDRDTQIISRRQRFSAVAWMAGNNPCRNQTLFTHDQFGIQPKTGVGLQGHQAQLLAVFGLINVPLNYPVYASKQKFTVNDILQREMRDCKVNSELTFTLIALSHYTDSDTTWIAGDGQDWSVPRVIQEELAQPIVGAACGGTHRLMGFGHALRRRRAEGKPIDGQWERADRYVKDFVNYTWSLQNRDGSMSTAWYEKPEDNNDIDRKIQTTGHMLEMLLTVTPDADLQSPQMLRTVNFMATTLHSERGHEWQIGPKGHALRSLAMYYQRVFGGATPWRPNSGSRSAGATSVRSVR